MSQNALPAMAFTLPQVIKECLPNGICVLLKQMPVQEYLVGISDKGGSLKNKQKNLPDGTAHMLEHVLVRQLGSQIRKKHNVNGKTTQTYMSIYGQGKGSAKASELAKSLLSAIGSNVLESSMTLETPRIFQEIAQVQNTCSAKQEAFISKVFKETLLDSSILGTPESLQKITQDNLQKLLNSTFTAGNTLLVGMGNINPEEILKIAKEIPNLKPPKESSFSIKHAHVEKTLLDLSSSKQQAAKDSNISALNENLFMLVGYKIPYRKSIVSYAAYLAIAHSIQKNALHAGLKIRPHLHYTEAGGLLYFKIPFDVYKSMSVSEMVAKATKNVIKDINELSHANQDKLALPLLDLTNYLFSIGLGCVTEDDLMNSVKNLSPSDIAEGLKIFRNPHYAMAAAM